MTFTGQEIPTCYARQLAKNYREDKLGKVLAADQTCGVWFDKKVFLDALELNEPDKVSGIRIYLGSYQDHASYPRNRDYIWKMTFIIVQTKASIDDQGKVSHIDILEDPDASPCYDPPFKEWNDGQICPPPRCDANGLLNF